jgi:hypothetical protein
MGHGTLQLLLKCNYEDRFGLLRLWGARTRRAQEALAYPAAGVGQARRTFGDTQWH